MSRPPSSLPVVRTVPRRAAWVPVASTVAASALSVLPVVATAPIWPPFGLLMLLSWRLLRPELWPAWMGLPLGLADDLLTGQPIGSGMALWTGAFLVIDWIDTRLLFRDYRLDWLIAAVVMAAVMIGGLVAAGTEASSTTILPQILLTILCFPLAQRLAARLDRWRLRR